MKKFQAEKDITNTVVVAYGDGLDVSGSYPAGLSAATEATSTKAARQFNAFPAESILFVTGGDASVHKNPLEEAELMLANAFGVRGMHTVDAESRDKSVMVKGSDTIVGSLVNVATALGLDGGLSVDAPSLDIRGFVPSIYARRTQMLSVFVLN